MIELKIKQNDKEQRLDRFLKKYFDKAPLSMIYKMIRKDIKINGKRGKEATLLAEGDVLQIYITEEQARRFHSEKKQIKAARQFTVVYEDKEMLVVSKPFGLLTHGDKREKKNTLANQVAGYLQEKGEYDPTAEQTFRPSPVNRLDRNTTGLVMFGKNAEALRRLSEEIKTREGISKYYFTIVKGRIDEEMVIEDSLAKDEKRNTVRIVNEKRSGEKNRIKDPSGDDRGVSFGNGTVGDTSGMNLRKGSAGDDNDMIFRKGTKYDLIERFDEGYADKGGKHSITIVRPVAWSDYGSVTSDDLNGKSTGKDSKKAACNKVRKEESKRETNYTLVEAELITGRTHQIRAHLAGVGHPIIGDAKYGDYRTNRYMKEKYGLSTQLLHAARLEFTVKGDIMEVTAPLPEIFERIKEDIFGDDHSQLRR